MTDETKESSLVVAIAKRIQWIEHNGRHSWESCMPTARIRAIEQAKACIDEIERFGAAIIYAEEQRRTFQEQDSTFKPMEGDR